MSQGPDQREPCLARTVARAFAEDPRLEAVSFHRDRKCVSVATLGDAQVGKIQETIGHSFQEAARAGSSRDCSLLQGKGECLSCALPLSEEEQRLIRIEHDEPNTTTIARVTCPTARTFWRWRDFPLPRVAPRRVELPQDDRDSEEWKFQLLAAAFCGAFGLLGYLANAPFSLIAFLGAYVAGGWFAAREVWERLRNRVLDVHFLMLAVAAGSAAIGAWEEGATLLFLFSLSGALEHFAFARTQREIRSLFRQVPKTAIVLDEAGRETETKVADLVPGMKLFVKPGGQFPVDGRITRGQTASDESNLTGEAAPVTKSPGDIVFSGTINLWGAVEAVVLRTAEQSALQKIIQLIQQAQQRKAPAQQFTDRFSAWYTYFALAGSFVMFFVWWLGFGWAPLGPHHGEPSAFYRTMTLLVVASPCALVLSIPSAVLAAIAWGARHGVLFRGGAAVEKLAATTAVALDKTGTLTTGELRVEKIESFPPGREREIAELAFSLTRLSSHPLSSAVNRHGRKENLRALEVHDFESITGQGLKGRVGGIECFTGRREYLEQSGKSLVDVPGLDGLSELWVSKGNILLGRVVLRDEIRSEARQMVGDLQSAGLRTVVLTGDRREAAERLREELGIQEIRFGLKPEEKLEAIAAMSGSGQKVAMIGDGVNDAPSLAAAHIGVAMGARGSDAALEQADLVLMHDRLQNFLSAYRLSQRARRVIRQNLVVSLGTVLVLVTMALLGKIPLTLGVVGHEGSTVLVVMNSLRLLFHGRNGEP